MKFQLVVIETSFLMRFVLCTDIEIFSIKKKLSTLNLVVKQFFVYMVLQYLCENHEFETIFTHNDVTNIQFGIDKEFGSR